MPNYLYLINFAAFLASELCGVAVREGEQLFRNAGFDFGSLRVMIFCFLYFYFFLFFFFTPTSTV